MGGDCFDLIFDSLMVQSNWHESLSEWRGWVMALFWRDALVRLFNGRFSEPLHCLFACLLACLY